MPENRADGKWRTEARHSLGFSLGIRLRRVMGAADMELTVLAFAQAREAFGFSSRVVSCAPGETPRGVLERIAPGPAWTKLALAVAVDGEYAAMDAPLGEARELALIPPVSGG
jgi:sulfur-carrier protein